MIWIYTVCKDRIYPGSAGQGLGEAHINFHKSRKRFSDHNLLPYILNSPSSNGMFLISDSSKTLLPLWFLRVRSSVSLLVVFAF